MRAYPDAKPSRVMRQIAIRLPADQVDRLDALALAWGRKEGSPVNRSRVLRSIVAAFLDVNATPVRKVKG